MQEVDEFLAEENNMLVAKQQHIKCQGDNEEKANAECNTIGHSRPEKSKTPGQICLTGRKFSRVTGP